MIKICCVCRKFEQEGQWLGEPVSPPQSVSHVYCPSCFEDFMDELDMYALQKWSKSVYTVVDAGQLLVA